MSATERLRELLDERGIEWWSKPRLVVGGVEKGTEFDAADGRWVCAIEALDGTICVSHLTPEQAVTVTLGAGTCHDKCSRFNAWVCSECGATVLLMFDDYDEPSYSVDGVADVPHFCPNCGRRVIE